MAGVSASSWAREPVAISDLSSVLAGHGTLTAMLEASLPAARTLTDGRSVLESGSVGQVHALLDDADEVLDALLRWRIAALADGVRTAARLRVTNKARQVAEVIEVAYDEHLLHVAELPRARRAALRGEPSLARWHDHLSAQGVIEVTVEHASAQRALDAARDVHATGPSRSSSARLMRASARVQALDTAPSFWHDRHARDNGLRPKVVEAVTSASLDCVTPVWESAFDAATSLSPAGDPAPVQWLEAVEAVLSGFASVAPAAEQTAYQALSSGWLDARSRPGRPEVFCTWHAPRGGHPVSLVTWEPTPAGLYLLAHELGHIVHQVHMNHSVHSLGPQYLASEFVATFLAQTALDAWAAGGKDRGARAALPPLDTWLLSALEHRFELAVHELAAAGQCTPRRLDAAWEQLTEGSPALARGFDSWESVRVALSWPGMVHTYAIATPAAVLAAAGDRASLWQASARAHELGALGLLAAAGLDVSTVAGARRMVADAAQVLDVRARPHVSAARALAVRVASPRTGSARSR